jgi:hypothetical protein
VFVFIFLLLFIGNIKSTFYKFMILLPRSSCVSSSNLKIYYKKNSNEYITPLRLAIYIYIYIYVFLKINIKNILKLVFTYQNKSYF